MPTFGVKETGLLAAVDHFLLALLGARYNGAELLARGAVVELGDMWLVHAEALHRHRSRAAVCQHRPHLLL